MQSAPTDTLASEPTPQESVPAPEVVRERIRYHATYFVLAGSVLVLAFILRIDGQGRVAIPGVGLPLPESCMYKRIVDADCPGCGLTRSFISLAGCDWQQAWAYNPTGIAFFLIVAAQLPYRLLQIRRARQGRSEWHPTKLSTKIAILLVAALMGQWVWRFLFT